MNLVRRSGSQLALVVLALLGAADAIYLTLVHYNDQVTLACPNTGFVNCANVITSKYSYVPGTTIPISIPGLGWCVVIIALALAGLYLGAEQRWLRIAEFFWTLLGILTVLYLVYAEIVQIRNICLWCTVLHVFILLMFLITLVRLPQHPDQDEEGLDVEEAESLVSSTDSDRIK